MDSDLFSLVTLAKTVSHLQSETHLAMQILVKTAASLDIMCSAVQSDSLHTSTADLCSVGKLTRTHDALTDQENL